MRNFHFFRMGAIPQLTHSFSELERKILLAAFTALLVCGSFLITQSYFSATKVVASQGGKYIEGLVGQPRFINPVLAAANNVDLDLARVIYSGLLKYDSSGQLQPDLASSLPEVSADQKTYTIHLRDKVLWHDGQPFGADDVVFTIHLIQNAAYQSPLRLSWNKVEVQKVDDRTITLVLKEANASFLSGLTQGILPKHIWESVDAANFQLSKYNLTQPIGTGPFKVRAIKKTEDGVQSITLQAFESYHLGRPYLDEVEFKFFESYDDLIAAYHSRDILGLGYIPFEKKVYVEKSSLVNLYPVQLPQYQALFFNRSKSAVLADKNVRAALEESVNRREIIDEVYMSAANAAFGPIPPFYLGYNPVVESTHAFNEENTKKLLDAAGFKPQEGSTVLKKGNQELAFTITTNNFPLNEKTADILKRQWEKLGFKVTLRILTIGELEQSALRPRDYEALLFSENIGADPDPLAFWHSSQRADPGLNLAMFSNKEADTLLVAARGNSDPSFRDKQYKRFQEIVADDIPAVFLVNSLYIYGVNSKVQGINLNHLISQSDRFQDIQQWYIETKRVRK